MGIGWDRGVGEAAGARGEGVRRGDEAWEEGRASLHPVDCVGADHPWGRSGGPAASGCILARRLPVAACAAESPAQGGLRAPGAGREAMRTPEALAHLVRGLLREGDAEEVLGARAAVHLRAWGCGWREAVGREVVGLVVEAWGRRGFVGGGLSGRRQGHTGRGRAASASGSKAILSGRPERARRRGGRRGRVARAPGGRRGSSAPESCPSRVPPSPVS